MRVTVLARAPRWACGLLSLALFASGASAAEDAATDLSQAVRAAWSNHPAAEATEKTLAAAQARAHAASQPLYNPELEFAVDDEADERTSTAGVALTLDWAGKRRARAALGDAEYTLAEAEAAQRRTAFALQWLQAWAERSSTLERVELGQQRLDLVARFADLAERQLKAGDISTLERDLALLARDEAQAEQATLLSEAASAQESFVAVGGRPETTPAPADSVPPPPAADIALELGAVPEARVAVAMARSAERRITVAERDRKPDPTISLRGGRIDLGPVSDNVLGVAVSVPLFVRNTYRAEVTAARADADAQSAEQRRVELELRARAERALRTHDAVRNAWATWSRSPGTDVAKRADLLERLWRAGELSTADYLIQLKQSLDTALAGADLRGRLWRSYVDALYATGRLDAWVGFDAPNAEVNP